MRVRADSPVLPFNRKYLGSKRQLREWLSERICAVAGTPRTFIDGFFGTGSVSVAMARRGVRKIIGRGHAALELRHPARIHDVQPADAAELMDAVNAAPPREGYIDASYCGHLFHRENCRRMDGMREEIERLRRAGEISAAEHDVSPGKLSPCGGQGGEHHRPVRRVSQEHRRAATASAAGTSWTRGCAPRSSCSRWNSSPAPAIEVREGDMIALAAAAGGGCRVFRSPVQPPPVLRQLPRAGESRPLGEAAAVRQDAQVRPHGLEEPVLAETGRRGGPAPARRGASARRTCSSPTARRESSRGRDHGHPLGRGATSVMEIPYPVFGNGAGVSLRRSVTEYLFHSVRDRCGGQRRRSSTPTGARGASTPRTTGSTISRAGNGSSGPAR